MKQETLIGTGILTWNAGERRGDRYGVVFLMNDGSTSFSLEGKVKYVPLNKEPKEGEYGQLIVEIIESRESTHIGDLFHGISPRKTKEGKRLVLGEGFIRREMFCDPVFEQIGVEPKDSPARWMDIRALYDSHEHLVKLIFVKE